MVQLKLTKVPEGVVIVSHPTPDTLHAWGDEWQRRKLALSKQLRDSYTTEQRQLVAEMNKCVRNLRLCKQLIAWPDEPG